MVNNPPIFDALRRHNIPFVIIGGHAVNHYGYIRGTEDVDIIWLRSPPIEIALTLALAEVSASYIGKEIDPSTGIERMHSVSLPYIQATHLMMLWTGSGFIDLFDYIPGYPTTDVNELFRTSVQSDGLLYTSLDWLTKMKRAAGRTKDLLDLKNLPPLPE